GKAAIAWNALFDKDGKVFASGLPPLGSIWRGVKAYDPRKDSTYPGGDGAHRWADPRDIGAFDAARETWEYTTSPGLLALRNALGSWERDIATPGSTYRKVFGAGIAVDGLIVGDFVALANVCDANGWACGGRIFEPGNRWDNLKRILASGGAEPAWRAGRLGVRVQSPRVALDTITQDDLADGEIVVGAMQGWEQRLNTLSPKYRSEAHKWEFVATEEPVVIASYLDEDGEEKREERQLELVQDATQARQLCAYELMDRRELGEIELPCKPRLRRYGPGDLLIVDLPEAGLFAQPAVILKRSLNPVTMGVDLILRGETPAKHAFALALTGTAPPTPALRTTAEIDEVVGANVEQPSVGVAITLGGGGGGSANTYDAADIDEIKRRLADANIP
ncbi:MAG: phage tail protein, partial [Sphingomonas bacterium]|nr:phage tail protein [Sphingomonas bacterium]